MLRQRSKSRRTNGEKTLLETIIVLLVILWALGAFVMPFGGGLIHILLVIAAIVLVIRLVQGSARV